MRAGLHTPSEMTIVDAVREPLIVLDAALRVVVASRSFYRSFKVTPEDTNGRLFFELGNGEWNDPGLQQLLTNIIPQHSSIEEYEVEREFAGIGKRTMLLNAREVLEEDETATSLLVAIEDITARRSLEREKDELLRQKDLLLQELSHRVNNSLHMVASILLLKAQTVKSDDTRQHLQDAHERVMAVATTQEQLQPAVFGAEIEIGQYLTRLCESLAASMIIDGEPITITTEAGPGTATSEQAVSIGLITVELVINAIKHAFPDRTRGTITVRFESSESVWRLSVSDNGIGTSAQLPKVPARSGLGTTIVEALSRQLGGRVVTSAGAPGTTVSITVPRPR